MPEINKSTLSSLRHACRGLRRAFKERNFRLFCLIGLFVLSCILLFPLVVWERIVLILLITLVLSLELINSQVERMLDLVEKKHNREVGWIKDISAAAVLVASIGATVVGFLILGPRFLEFFLK
jgi:undecaprenol kinase